MASNVRNYIDQTREEAAVRLADDAVDTALQTEIDQIETSVGLNSDGTFTANAASNYIKLGTTIKYSLTLLDAQVKTNADDIAGLGDTTALQTEIDHIETGTGLNTDGTYSAPTGSNYINSSSSLKDADDKLDTQIKNNTTDIANEITDRTTAVGTVQSEINDTQTGAGLLATGAYSANVAANYISVATSLKDADNKLDSKLFDLESDKLESSVYTAADILTKIKTVDGSGSGLDADLLDAHEASYFASVTSAARQDFQGNLKIGIGSTNSMEGGQIDFAAPTGSGLPVPFFDVYSSGSNKQVFRFVNRDETDSWTTVCTVPQAGGLIWTSLSNDTTLVKAPSGVLPTLDGSNLTNVSAAPISWQTKTSSYTASTWDKIIADTSSGAFTITLPSSPSIGDTVEFLDGSGTHQTNNLTIARNGSNIMGSASDLIADVDDAKISLTYANSTEGWKVN